MYDTPPIQQNLENHKEKFFNPIRRIAPRLPLHLEPTTGFEPR
jgi:hypothetical protein